MKRSLLVCLFALSLSLSAHATHATGPYPPASNATGPYPSVLIITLSVLNAFFL